MRIIAGKHKGRKLDLPKECVSVRPTSDFARESIFNLLTHGRFLQGKDSILGKKVLDLFCGSGALGLEALSRGAKSASFIDVSNASLGAAKYNAGKLGELENCEFLQADASKLGMARAKYDLVFLDPPYFDKLLAPSLLALRSGGWLAEDALMVVEHDKREQLKIPEVFTVLDSRRYGRASIEIMQAKGEN